MNIAIFPGSFDPFTSGHEAIVRRALKLFDQIYIAVGVNTEKKYMFSVEERLAHINDLFHNDPQIHVVAYSDMTVDLCHRLGARFILRGIRNEQDLAYEQTVAAVNHQLDPDIDTIILLSDQEHRNISSTLVREQLTHQNIH